MQATISRNDLLRLASTAGRFVSKGSTLAVLTMFLVEAKDGAVRIHATNLEKGIIIKSKATVTTPGSVCVDATKFQNFVSLFTDDSVEITVKGFVMGLKCGNSDVHLNGLDPQEFPPIANLDPAAVAEDLSVDELQDVAVRVAFAASSDSKVTLGRPFLGCVYFTGKTADATDSFILATTRFSGIGGAMVPAESVIEAGKVFKTAKALKGYFTNGRVTLVSDQALMICNTIAGAYPDIKAMFPKKYAVSIKVDRAKALGSMAQIMVVASDERVAKRVRFTADDVLGNLNFYTRDEFAGEATIDVPAELTGKATTFFSNGEYVKQAIERSSTATVFIRANDPLQPFEISDDTDWRCLISPMHPGFGGA